MILVQSIYTGLLYGGLTILIIGFWWARSRMYTYPLYRWIIQTVPRASVRGKFLYYGYTAARIVTLLLLSILLADFQWSDPHTRVVKDTRDIILALDMSGSMLCRDGSPDAPTRAQAMLAGAREFVRNRPYDACGIVFFARDVLVRMPVTPDLQMVDEVLRESTVGVINPDGTLLHWGLAAAVNRLKKSVARSKIVIVFSDGDPSEQDLAPERAIGLARELGIRVYTIGYMPEPGSVTYHPLYGPMRVPGQVDMSVLEAIARDTGGRALRARNSNDITALYQEIDSLEKTAHEYDQHGVTYPVYIFGIIIVILLLFSERILVWWRGIL